MGADGSVSGTRNRETDTGPDELHAPAGSGRSFATIYIMTIGAIVLALGLVLCAGGLWLIMLGGSWYYAIAGAGLIVSGAMLFRRHVTGVGVYLLIWIGTLIWAVWEVGFELWPLVPRVVAPTVLLVFVLLTIPAFAARPASHPFIARHGRAYQPLSILLSVGLGLSSLAADRALAAPDASSTLAISGPTAGTVAQPPFAFRTVSTGDLEIARALPDEI